MRDTLIAAVGLEDDLHVAGHWPDAESALADPRCMGAHVAVVDYRLPGMNGIRFSKILQERSPRTNVLIISAHRDPHIIFEAFEAGVTGFVHKSTPLSDLVHAIRAVRRGERVLSPRLLQSFIE